MNEKEVKLLFAEKYLERFPALFGAPVRLYALELPIRTADGEKYADMVLEDETKGQLYVLEWKVGLVDCGVCEQVMRYSGFVGGQLYRQPTPMSFLVGQEFSKWELQVARENGVGCIQYDMNGNLRIVGGTSAAS